MSLTIDCESFNQLKDVTLKNAGIFSLENNCTAHSFDVILFSNAKFPSRVREYSPIIDSVKPLFQILNKNMPPNIRPMQINVKNIEEIQFLDHKVRKFENTFNQQKSYFSVYQQVEMHPTYLFLPFSTFLFCFFFLYRHRIARLLTLIYTKYLYLKRNNIHLFTDKNKTINLIPSTQQEGSAIKERKSRYNLRSYIPKDISNTS